MGKSYVKNKDLYKFITKIDVYDDRISCWGWTGSLDHGGYGRIRTNLGTTCYAHRMSYEIFIGPIPEGAVIDHICKNRSCVNPEHLEAVTQQINVLRGDGICSKNAKKTSCRSGHPYNEENTYIRKDGKGRDCRICRKKRELLFRLRRAKKEP